MRFLTVSFGGSVAFNGQTRRLSCVCLSLPAHCVVVLWNSATSFAVPCIFATKSTYYPSVMLPWYRQTFQAGVWMVPGVNLGPNAFIFSKDRSMSFLQYFFRKPWTYIGTCRIILSDDQQGATILASFFNPNQLCIFRAMSSPIIRSI